uniref:Putative leucine-rich repeat domain, L domain-like protein n=1 Tax=Helianthus annuus TaxID=4232 RepID=A0A251S4X2_HELAN
MSIILNKILELLFRLVLILLALILFEVTDVHAQAGYPPPDEVQALRDIAKEVGKRDWNFSLNPCGNNSNWVTPNPTETYNNTVQCNCSYPRGVCHVIKIFLKGQDLDGVLPPSLAKLPYIKTIDLTRNYLNGTIPPEWASTNLEYFPVCYCEPFVRSNSSIFGQYNVTCVSVCFLILYASLKQKYIHTQTKLCGQYFNKFTCNAIYHHQNLPYSNQYELVVDRDGAWRGRIQMWSMGTLLLNMLALGLGRHIFGIHMTPVLV